MKPDEIAITVLYCLVFILIIFFILAIIQIVNLNDTKHRIDKTIQNKIFCPADTTNPSCKLQPNLNLDLPANNSEFDPKLAHFGCNLIGCLEISLQTKPITPIMLPKNVSLDLQIVYGTNIIALVCSTENATWVVFRGTHSEEEWKQDLMIEQVSSTSFQGLLHKGFLNIYSQIKQQILDILKQKNADNYLYICGHSLGGALSQLLLLDSQNLNFVSKQAFLFGCPRLGNPVFAASLTDLNIFRFTNDADLVCQLPPPVSPNFVGNANDVFLYQHNQKIDLNFIDNRSSYYQNHALQTYLTIF